MATESIAQQSQCQNEGQNVQGQNPQDGHSQEGQTQSPNSNVASEDQQAALRKAEEIVDRAAQRLSGYASDLRRQLQTMTARTREEAEDIWAEAQQLRRGGPPSP